MAKTKKDKKQESQELSLSKMNRWWSEAESERKQYDWKWYMYGLWVRGYHYARYDANTKRIISKPKKDGRPKVVINKIYPTLRAIRNYALRNKPKAQVTPEGMSEDGLDDALKATKFLDYIHEVEKLRPKLKGTVWQALENSVGWWQVIWNGEKIEVNPVDTFDFYPDPKARSTKEMRYGILAVRRKISDLLEDEKYIKEEVEQVKPDNKVAASSYKQMLLSYDKADSGMNESKSKESGTVIVKEFWYREEDKIYVSAEAGGRMIRKPEEVDSPIIPFFKLASDIMPFQMYGEGWVKGMIDPQKILNSAMSSIAEYNLVMNKVKVVADKGAGLRTWNNQHGQFIEKKRGYNVTTQPTAPMNSAIFQQVELADRFLEDIGSMHDAMSGRVPTGAKSGKAIEALQLGDSNNMSELVENIEDFLEDVYEYILWIASKKYQDLKDIVVTDYTGQREFFKVIGEEAPTAEGFKEDENVLVVGGKNMVDVQISSYLSFTPEGKRESVKELVSILPELPENVILDAFGVGNIAEVIKGIKQKREEEKQAELQAQRQQQEQSQDISNPSSGGQEAIAAIRTLIEGGSPQVPSRASDQYIQAIDQFLQREGQMGELDPQIIQAIQTFRDQVVQGVGR